MISAMKASSPLMATKITEIEDAKAVGADVGKLFDGAFIQALVAWCVAHPDQISAIIKWILLMAGVTIPLPFAPAEEE